MEKTTIRLKGKIAEMFEMNGIRQANIICDINHLMIQVKNIGQLEFGSDVIIIGELDIKSIQLDESVINKTDSI